MLISQATSRRLMPPVSSGEWREWFRGPCGHSSCLFHGSVSSHVIQLPVSSPPTSLQLTLPFVLSIFSSFLHHYANSFRLYGQRNRKTNRYNAQLDTNSFCGSTAFASHSSSVHSASSSSSLSSAAVTERLSHSASILEWLKNHEKDDYEGGEEGDDFEYYLPPMHDFAEKVSNKVGSMDSNLRNDIAAHTVELPGSSSTSSSSTLSTASSSTAFTTTDTLRGILDTPPVPLVENYYECYYTATQAFWTTCESISFDSIMTSMMTMMLLPFCSSNFFSVIIEDCQPLVSLVSSLSSFGGERPTFHLHSHYPLCHPLFH